MADLAGGSIAMDIKSVFDRTSFNTVISDLTSQFSKASDDMGKLFGANLSKGMGNSASAMRMAVEQQLRSAQSAVDSAMSGMVKATNSQANALSDLEIKTKKVSEVTAKYGEDSSKAMKAALDQQKAQQGLADAQTRVLKATNDLSAAEQVRTDAQAKAKQASDSHAASMATLGAAFNTAGLAITGGFVAAVGMGIDKAAEFQTSQNRLVTSAGELTSNLKQVSDGILSMAGQVGMSVQELSNGMYTVESAGYHGADSLKVLQAAAQGAKMEGADLKTVADAVSTALTDYHMSADQAGVVTSQLVTAVGQGKTNMEEFSGSLHSVTPLAAAAHVSLADVTGSLAEMTSHGMSADQASQNLADTLRHLMSTTGPMRDELQQLGLTSTDLQNSLSTQGLAGTLEMLSDKVMSKMGPDGKVMLDSFNSSKDAAKNLQTALKALPQDMQPLAKQFLDGSITAGEWIKAIKDLPANQRALASSFTDIYNKSQGFTNFIKNGSTQAQTYTQAMKNLTGDVAGLNTTLMLTGENAKDTNNNIKLISGATTDAAGNVKGWQDIQGTFNQRLAEFKASIGSSAISLGNAFLPAATNVAKELADVANWFGRNKTAGEALVITLGAIAAGFTVWKIAQGVMAVQEGIVKGVTWAYGLMVPAQEAATGAQVELDAAMDANPIGAVVLAVEAVIAALAALAIGVKYAYDHWKWFHDAVQDVWNVLKVVGEWIGKEAVAAWHLLLEALHPVETAFKAVADAAMWLWHNAIQPAAEGIGTALKVVGAVVMTVLAVPFVLAFKMIEAAVKFLYENVIQPDFKLLEIIFHWLYDNVVKPVVELIKLEIQGFGLMITWLHDNVIDPIFHVIGDVWHWLYDTVIHPIIDLIKADIQAWGEAFHWLHDTVIKPVGDAIHSVMDGMKTAFKDVVDWLDQQWGRIEGIVGPPVRFIVDTIYNQGIVPTWNAIAGVFGLGPLDTVDAGNLGGSSQPTFGGGGGDATFAGGGIWQGPGVLPGYAPGKDTLPAVLSPGEGVAVPELVQAIGPQRFMQLNWMYSNGRQPGAGPGFDGGGVVGTLGDIVGGVVNAGKSAVSGELDTAKFMAKLAIDPEGAVRDLFSKVIGQTGSTPGGPSQWRDALVALPAKVVDTVVDKAKTLLTGSGGKFAPGVPFTGTPDLMGWIAQAEQVAGVGAGWTPGLVTLIGRESGGNPNAINNWDSNAAAGDPSRGLMQTIGCVPITTAILTKRGWLAHNEVFEGDETLGYNPNTGCNEWTKITRVVHYDDAVVWRIGSRKWHADVTPEHRWVSQTRKRLRPETLSHCPECGFESSLRGVSTHRGRVHHVERLPKRTSYLTRFVRTSEINAEDRIVLAAPAATGSGIAALSDDEAAIIAWIQGDGWLGTAREGGWDASIFQAKPAMVAKLRLLLKNVPHTESMPCRRDNHTWQPYSFRLRRAYVTELVKRAELMDQPVDEWILRLSPSQRGAWLQAMIDAEGHTRDGFTRISQADGPVQDAIRVAVYLEGYQPTFSASSAVTRGYKPSGAVGMARPIAAANMFVDPEVLDRQTVWCVETELGSWTMRQENRITLTGNSTFEANRSSSLPDNIYDPVANIVAGIRYIRSRYGVSQDGSDLSAKVQQADASRAPQGYAGGGIAGTSKKTKKQADPTAINRGMGWLQSVVGGRYVYGSALDCSGMVSGLYQELIGGNPSQRAFTTISDFAALGFLRGTGGIFDIGVLPLAGEQGHMAATFNGHNVESSSDHGIAMDGAARGANDPMFKDHWYLPGRLFVPPWTGGGATPTADQSRANKLTAAGQKYASEAQKYTTEANNALQEAQKHDTNAEKYLDEANHAKTAKAKADYLARAKTAQDAAAKSRDTAAKDQQKAKDAQAKADQAEADSSAQSSDTTTEAGSSSSSSAASSSTSGILTFHQLGEKLGGIGADFLTESFGLDNTANIIANSRILKVGNAIANAKVGAPYLDKFFEIPNKNTNLPGGDPKPGQLSNLIPKPTTKKDQDKDISASVYDDGGWLQPGDLAVNLGSRPEPILSPQHADAFQKLVGAGVGGGDQRPWVNIEHITHVGGDEHTTAKRIVREMNVYQGRGPR